MVDKEHRFNSKTNNTLIALKRKEHENLHKNKDYKTYRKELKING